MGLRYSCIPYLKRFARFVRRSAQHTPAPRTHPRQSMSEAAGRAVSSAETRLLELQGENRRLRGVLSQLQDDQRDIYYFLQKKLDDNYEVISALEQKIINWQVT